MRQDEARNVIALIAGLWPTPAMADEEAAAWGLVLVRSARISREEATTVLVAVAENGAQWRPRPGELIAMVQHERRQRALRTPRPALPSGEKIASKETQMERLAACKRLMAGQEA